MVIYGRRRVRTVKLGKSWNCIISFSRPGKVTENSVHGMTRCKNNKQDEKLLKK